MHSNPSKHVTATNPVFWGASTGMASPASLAVPPTHTGTPGAGGSLPPRSPQGNGEAPAPREQADHCHPCHPKGMERHQHPGSKRITTTQVTPRDGEAVAFPLPGGSQSTAAARRPCPHVKVWGNSPGRKRFPLMLCSLPEAPKALAARSPLPYLHTHRAFHSSVPHQKQNSPPPFIKTPTTAKEPPFQLELNGAVI